MQNPLLLVQLFLFTFLSLSVFAQSVDNSYYLPEMEYDEKITTPQEYLGFQIGEWHITSEQIKGYCKKLATESNRINIEKYGYSNERKELFVLNITKPDRFIDLESIRIKHVNNTEFDQEKTAVDELPLIIYQGYSIHGNESSGASAAMMMAYYLAAGEGSDVLNLLDEAIILIDPCMNPDGLDRFANWVNRNKSETLVTDPLDEEFNEPWPNGRTNHYWTDLNRDWLFMTQPESKARVKIFQKWRPHILTDHHEMGKNSTFFFQPGVPERTNPLTPPINQVLTESISKYHKIALDSLGSKYFTKKRFDDYYYGKGSSYPDIQGCIGILFEQASSRGHMQETANGTLSFPFTVRNQIVTSISTQKAALGMKDEIKKYKAKDTEEVHQMTQSYERQYLRFSRKNYRERADYLAEILDKHDIHTVYDLQEESYYIPLMQRQYRLIRTIFERVNQFKSKVFYDVSAWTLPLAFGIEYDTVSVDNKLFVNYNEIPPLIYQQNIDSFNYYIIPWGQWNATKVLEELLVHHVKSYSYRGDEYSSAVLDYTMQPGDIIIHIEGDDRESIVKLLESIVHKYPINFYGVKSINLEHSKPIELPKVAMIIGKGMHTYQAGDIWYQFDKRMNMPLTKINHTRLNNQTFNRYTHIIIPSSRRSVLEKKDWERLQQWISKGGTLITFGNGLKWANRPLALGIEFEDLENNDFKQVHNQIGGAIFKIDLKRDGQLGLVFDNRSINILKQGEVILKEIGKSKATGSYTKEPLLSGYSSLYTLDKIKESPAIISKEIQRGRIIGMIDNPLFRGYWLDGIQLFENMIFQ